MTGTTEIEGRNPAGPPAGEACDEPRIYGPYPARVRGTGAGVGRFKADAALESLGVDGFRVRLGRRVEPGERLSVSARINRAVVSLCGTVISVSALADGAFDADAVIIRYRFVHRPAGHDRPAPHTYEPTPGGLLS
ncbi:MAG TPA: hypothetical protein VEY09_04355 [Pyrinomonadaceae bacterium]|nr:hypothetical protein [Pyrinomonadaceae bacterium]